jgi:TorA maturation chaperone TorD
MREGAIGAAQLMDDVDCARALAYRLLGQALAKPPDAAFLQIAGGLGGEDGPIGAALCSFAALARSTGPDSARREYDALFIGIARGELLPYASYYLTGFLNERPLARLRADMQRLGFEPVARRSEPEDHIATECEIMAGLIEDAPEPVQAEFFEHHLAPWTARFFGDLEHAAAARLYRPLGTLGRLLVVLDGDAYGLPQTTALQRGAA